MSEVWKDPRQGHWDTGPVLLAPVQKVSVMLVIVLAPVLKVLPQVLVLKILPLVVVILEELVLTVAGDTGSSTDSTVDMARYEVQKGPMCHVCVPVTLCLFLRFFKNLFRPFLCVFCAIGVNQHYRPFCCLFHTWLMCFLCHVCFMPSVLFGPHVSCLPYVS